MLRRTLLALPLIVAAGCSRRTGSKRPPLIAVVMKSLANGFFVTMADGARADQARRSSEYRLLLNGTRNESDLAQQVAIIDQMIARGVDAIVIAPADSKAVVPALARARRAGIVVINIDNRLDAQVLRDYAVSIPFVGPDNRLGARAVGLHAASLLKAGDQIAILEGISTADNSRARRMGLEDAAHAANLTIVSQQSALWDQAKAAELSSALLVRYPDLKAIFCANDSMAMGAVAAVTKAGKQRQVIVTGFDNVPAMQPLIEQGQVAATADQHGGELAVYGIDYALRALRSSQPLPDIKTPVDLVHRALPDRQKEL